MEEAGFAGGFGFERFEESRGKHVRSGLNHALAHTGDQAADVNVTRVLDFRCPARVFQIQIAGALYESRLAFAVNDEL